jgi:hypothetical protein
MHEYTQADVAARFGIKSRQFRRYLSEAARRGIAFPGVTHRGYAGARPDVVYTDEFITAFGAYLAQRRAAGPAEVIEVIESVGPSDAISGDAAALRDVLRKTTATPIDELADTLDCSPRRIRTLLDELTRARYDIRLEEVTAELRRVPTEGSAGTRPRWSGATHQTFGVTSDRHYCNRHSKVRSIQQAYQTMAEAGCQFVVDAGDIFDGCPAMHKGFEFDLGIAGMDAQLDFVEEIFPSEIPTLMIPGNHCLSWYKQAGANVVKQLCDRKPETWLYAGTREAFLHGPTGKPNLIYLKHPGDGSSYARSYKSQKLAEWLHDAVNDVAIDLEARELNLYPRLVFLGHYHKYCHIRGPYSSHFFTLPSLCGMTSFQSAKALFNEMGFLTVTITFDDDAEPVGLTWTLRDVVGGDEWTYVQAPPSRTIVTMDRLWSAPSA